MIGSNELLPWKLSCEDLLIEDRIVIPPTHNMVTKHDKYSVVFFLHSRAMQELFRSNYALGVAK